MLFLVLLLVLGAFGLLVAALTTAHTVWAWISVVVSVVAAVLLVVDWVGSRKRRAAAADRAPAPTGAPDIERIDPPPPVEPRDGPRFDPDLDGPGPDYPVDLGFPAEADPIPAPDESARPDPDLDPDREPAEESTDAADLLVVADLQVDVRVLDERPRYHLTRCGWLGGRESIPLPVAEARQLGFTPCGLCTPDAVLAARHREGRGPRQSRTESN
ncbi:hypothetical protein [Actinokineospora inagensis]|uniref:hypothetical protein n=1 Tax=Actinokineospora inagensis TaxID=103730 RepID=UPI000412B401|nr:hypothetical protein [Actinokineospora inagensis]